MPELNIEDLVIGTGEAVANGHQVSVHCTGLLENGDKFDSSLDRGQPLGFVVGSTDVIKGLSMGVCGMKVGGKRKFTVPAEFGYGEEGIQGVIPPNAQLMYEVELLELSYPPFPFDLMAFRDFRARSGNTCQNMGTAAACRRFLGVTGSMATISVTTACNCPVT